MKLRFGGSFNSNEDQIDKFVGKKSKRRQISTGLVNIVRLVNIVNSDWLKYNDFTVIYIKF